MGWGWMWGFSGSSVLGFRIGILGGPRCWGFVLGFLGSLLLGFRIGMDGLGLDVGVLGVSSLGVPYWDSWGSS